LSTINHSVEQIIDTSVAPVIVGFIIIIALLVPSIIGVIKRNSDYRRTGFRTLCALTPLSLLYPWVVVPGNLGMSYGGYGFFLEWLTKYPNFGAVNIEVFIGIGCVLFSSLLPAIICAMYTFKRHRKVIIALTIIEIAAYLPVLIKLDWLLFLSGVMGNSWMGGGSGRDMMVMIGPVLRLVSFIVIAGTAITTIRMSNSFQSSLGKIP
jgi:uncharacterized membrane protein YhaH (DUF805 family)